MSHKDDASVLPGNAPQLAGMADPVYNAVSAGAFEELGTRFTEAGGKVAGATNKVKTVVGDVDGAWNGASAASFVNYMKGFTAAGQSVSTAVTDVAADLHTAATAVQGARDVLEGVFANLVTDVQALGQSEDEEAKEAKVNEAVERYRPQVVEQVNAANKALTNAASLLSGRANGIKPKFSSLAAPDTGRFAPANWTPVPQSPGAGGTVDKILDTARGELGYQEGPGNANKYGPSAAWCSSFATWVWGKSGVDIPSLPFTGDVYDWGTEHGLAYDKDNLGQARPGDVLLFGSGPENTSTSTHVGVVESVDGDQVTLIEGNSSDRVQRVTHTLSGSTFYGGVHPQ